MVAATALARKAHLGALALVSAFWLSACETGGMGGPMGGGTPPQQNQ